MINRIGFKNVRVFKEQQWFDLAPLTVLTGANNTGKSTIQKMLILLMNSFTKDNKGKLDIEHLRFTGDVEEKIGGFNTNVTYNSDTSNELSFSVEINDKLYGDLDCFLTYSRSKSGHGRLSKIDLKKKDDQVMTFECLPLKNTFSKEQLKKIQIRHFVKAYSDKKVWRCFDLENNFNNVVGYLRQFLIEAKNKGYEQDMMIDIDSKSSLNRELNKQEKDFLAGYEKKGAEFNSSRAQGEKDMLMDAGIPLPEWNIWDSKGDNFWPFDKQAKEISEIFHQPEKSLLIASRLSELILGQKDLLNSDVTGDEELSIIKKDLVDNNIFTKEQFIDSYIVFEHRFLVSILLMLNSNQLVQDEYVNDVLHATTFYEFFDPKELKNHEIQNALINHFKIYKNEVIERIISDEIQGYTPEEYTTQRQPSFIEPDKRRIKTINRTESKSYDERIATPFALSYKFLSKYWFQPIISTVNELNAFISRLTFSLQIQNKGTKRHYLNSDASNKESIFFEAGKKYIENYSSFGESKDKFIKKWLGFDGGGFNLADDLVIRKIMTQGKNNISEFIGVSYYLKKNDLEYQLADNGYGVNYLIMLLLQIVLSKGSSNRYPIIVLEEPETNLHPNYQQKLADLLVDAMNTLGILFIVETHSEYLIRKLQILTKNNVLKPAEVNIYYFKNPEEMSELVEQVRLLKILDDGKMEGEFGPEFLDMATRLTMDLLRIKNHN